MKKTKLLFFFKKKKKEEEDFIMFPDNRLHEFRSALSTVCSQSIPTEQLRICIRRRRNIIGKRSSQAKIIPSNLVDTSSQ